MVYSARTLALLLAVSIAIITGLFLSLLDGVNGTALAVAGLISFSASYLLFFITLEFLFFREINKIYKMMEKLRRKELSGLVDERPVSSIPWARSTKRSIHSRPSSRKRSTNSSSSRTSVASSWPTSRTNSRHPYSLHKVLFIHCSMEL